MNIESRDKKALLVGGVAILVILVLGYGVIPAVRHWSTANGASATEQAYVASLRESVRSQEATVKERNALVLRLGSLFGPQPSPETKEEEKKKEKEQGKEPEATPATPAPETPPPSETGKGSGADASVSGDNARPQEGNAQQAGDAGKPAPPKADTSAPAIDDASKTESPKPERTQPEGPKAEGPKPDGPKAKAPSGANTLASYIEQNAKKSGATVKRITPKKSATAYGEAKRFRPVTLQVSIECTIQNLFDLLKTLEKGERFVKVDQFQLKRDLASGSKLEVTMDLHSYEAEAESS